MSTIPSHHDVWYVDGGCQGDGTGRPLAWHPQGVSVVIGKSAASLVLGLGSLKTSLCSGCAPFHVLLDQMGYVPQGYVGMDRVHA